MSRRKVTVILLILLLLGYVLRSNKYQTWPREGATFDEYAWTWLGINILQKGVPISWSPHPQYKNKTYYNQRGAHFWLVRPYLEHPPLFGLIAGGYALLRGTPDMYHVKLGIVRELSLILGVVSIYLVFLLASKVYGSEVGLWSSGIYAITPTIAVGSRLLQNENFFIPFFILILYAAYEYIEKKKDRYFYVIAILSGIITLAKVPWFAAAIAVTLLLLYAKKIREVLLFWPIVMGIFGLFMMYGFYLDKSLFFSLWNLQLHRYDMAFDSIYSLITQPFLADRYFLDGIIYAGWISFVLICTEKIDRHKYIIFGLLAYLFIFVSAIPNEPSHGWYRYPLYPFLSISLGYFVHEYLYTKRIISSAFMLLIGLSFLSHTWSIVFGFSYFVYRLYIAWTMFGMLPLWFPNKFITKISNMSITFQVVVLALLSLWTTFGYNEQ